MKMKARRGPEAKVRPLWTCPRCGLKLVTRNLWHSCGQATLDDWKGKMGPSACEKGRESRDVRTLILLLPGMIGVLVLAA